MTYEINKSFRDELDDRGKNHCKATSNDFNLVVHHNPNQNNQINNTSRCDSDMSSEDSDFHYTLVGPDFNEGVLSDDHEDTDLVFVDAMSHEFSDIQRSLFCLGNTDTLIDSTKPFLVLEKTHCLQKCESVDTVPKSDLKQNYRLFIGGVDAALDTKTLARAGITRVLNANAVPGLFRVGLKSESSGVSYLVNSEYYSFVQNPMAFYESKKMDIADGAMIEIVENLPIEDAEDFDISIYFKDAFDFLSRSEADYASTLVVCERGIGPSAAIILSYLMKSRKWSLKKACATLQRANPFVAPNRQFVKALLALESSLNLSWAQKIAS